jgi:hypothetical protein
VEYFAQILQLFAVRAVTDVDKSFLFSAPGLVQIVLPKMTRSRVSIQEASQ